MHRTPGGIAVVVALFASIVAVGFGMRAIDESKNRGHVASQAHHIERVEVGG